MQRYNSKKPFWCDSAKKMHAKHKKKAIKILSQRGQKEGGTCAPLTTTNFSIYRFTRQCKYRDFSSDTDIYELKFVDCVKSCVPKSTSSGNFSTIGAILHTVSLTISLKLLSFM